jgi:hypothetical protein
LSSGRCREREIEGDCRRATPNAEMDGGCTGGCTDSAVEREKERGGLPVGGRRTPRGMGLYGREISERERVGAALEWK